MCVLAICMYARVHAHKPAMRASPLVAQDALGMEMLGNFHNGHSPPTTPWRGLRAVGLHI